jgi:hypothetical protein
VGDQIGATAREYKIYINHRPDETNAGRPNQVVSSNVKKGVKILIEEAMRGEEEGYVFSPEGKIFSGCALKTVSEERVFQCSSEVSDYLDADYTAHVKRRRGVSDEDAGGLEWSQKVRKPQLDKGMALLIARTDATINNTIPIIEMSHIDFAREFSAEVHRAESANRDDFADAYRLCETKFKESCKKGFSHTKGISIDRTHPTQPVYEVTHSWVSTRMQHHIAPIRELPSMGRDQHRAIKSFVEHHLGDDSLFSVAYTADESGTKVAVGRWQINRSVIDPLKQPFNSSKKVKK